MQPDLVASIQTQASQCVKCGLCLPYCPTYGLTQNENESPRGRIALMHNLATEALTLSPKAHEHIDNCLSCKECERVCPAGVTYESLLLSYRAWEEPQIKSPPNSTHFLEYIVSYPSFIQALAKILWFTQKIGLRTLAKQLGLIQLLGLSRLNALLPKTLPYPTPLKDFYPAIGPKKGVVALFTGCLSALFDSQTNQDAIRVLQHLGYDIVIPKTQACCGAIAAHAGKASQAKSLLDKNLAAFSEASHIITTASGCASMLINDALFSDKIIDITDFICQATWPDSVLATLAQNLPRFRHEKITVHTPCTLRNSLKKPQVSQNLLERLGLNCTPLQTKEQCCGSAGTYMVSHAATSEKLLDSALIDLDKTTTTRLVTSNIGCALHFQKRFNEQNSPILVCHTVSLFAEMLAND
jgi:glycolate oxidase iron-sulfur subunit